MIFNLNIQPLELDKFASPDGISIALISDTHTSRSNPITHPNLLPLLTEIHPDVILHAGDIAMPLSLVELGQIAPVYAVKGNRDISNFRSLPDAYAIQVAGKKVFLTHGHAPLLHYLIDKFHYFNHGFQFPRYYTYLKQIMDDAHVYLFGHTHIVFCQKVNGQLFINPGAACNPTKHDPHPSFAVLRFEHDKEVKVRTMYL